MKLQKIYIILCGFYFLLSCKKEKSSWPLTFVQYTDSTYTKQIKDTLRLDSIAPSFTGYFRIYKWGTEPDDSYEQGELKKGLKVGGWLTYFGEKKLMEKINYNEQGREDGKHIGYYSNGIESMILNYKDGAPYGEQLRYFENGDISMRNFVNEKGLYGEYLNLKSIGDTLYYTDLGDSGTGYMKEYTADGFLEQEGKYKDGNYQDTVKKYKYDQDGKCLYMDLADYRGDKDAFLKFLKRIPCK